MKKGTETKEHDVEGALAAALRRLGRERLLSSAPQSVDDFLGVLVAALPAPLREILL